MLLSYRYGIKYEIRHKTMYIIFLTERRTSMNITIAKQAAIRANMKKYFDLAYDGETIIVPRKENRNVVILSEQEYKRMEKARRNAEYLAMLEESDRQLHEGRVVVKTMEELEAMACKGHYED